MNEGVSARNTKPLILSIRKRAKTLLMQTFMLTT
jgi:hypothetical protein